MARTLSDTLIVAVLEAATRLTGARGAIAGSAAAKAAQSASVPSTGDPADAPIAGAAPAGTNPSDAALAAASKGDSPPNAGAKHDSRSAEQIAADFRKIYAQIEELVRGSAEQETKSVGFGRG